jgi:hypothetical protein
MKASLKESKLAELVKQKFGIDDKVFNYMMTKFKGKQYPNYRIDNIEFHHDVPTLRLVYTEFGASDFSAAVSHFKHVFGLKVRFYAISEFQDKLEEKYVGKSYKYQKDSAVQTFFISSLKVHDGKFVTFTTTPLLNERDVDARLLLKKIAEEMKQDGANGVITQFAVGWGTSEQYLAEADGDKLSQYMMKMLQEKFGMIVHEVFVAKHVVIVYGDWNGADMRDVNAAFKQYFKKQVLLCPTKPMYDEYVSFRQQRELVNNESKLARLVRIYLKEKGLVLKKLYLSETLRVVLVLISKKQQQNFDYSIPWHLRRVFGLTHIFETTIEGYEDSLKSLKDAEREKKNLNESDDVYDTAEKQKILVKVLKNIYQGKVVKVNSPYKIIDVYIDMERSYQVSMYPDVVFVVEPIDDYWKHKTIKYYELQDISHLIDDVGYRFQVNCYYKIQKKDRPINESKDQREIDMMVEYLRNKFVGKDGHMKLTDVCYGYGGKMYFYGQIFGQQGVDEWNRLVSTVRILGFKTDNGHVEYMAHLNEADMKEEILLNYIKKKYIGKKFICQNVWVGIIDLDMVYEMGKPVLRARYVSNYDEEEPKNIVKNRILRDGLFRYIREQMLKYFNIDVEFIS